MSTIVKKWYHEGAPPVWHVKCPCDRSYFILEHQKFPCDCLKHEISRENTKEPVKETNSVSGILNQ